MAKSNLKEKEDYTVKSSDFLIKKITMKENKAIIEYSTDDDFRVNESKFKVKDEITEDFKTIWQNALAIITELTPQLYKEVAALKINSISFEYDGDFLEKVSIAVVWSIDDNGHILNLNYNNYPIYKPEFAENVIAISGKHEELLHKILKAAKAYMNGETRTKQMSLIVDNTK